MYINTGYEITNTPSQFIASYNTYPYLPPNGKWDGHVTRYYIDYDGKIKAWNSWNPPRLLRIPGGQYKGTPTRTGSFYIQNVIVDPRQK